MGGAGTRLRHFTFHHPAIKAAMLPDSVVDSNQLDALVNTLRATDDTLLAGDFVFNLLEAMQKDKKGKKLPEVSLAAA